MPTRWGNYSNYSGPAKPAASAIHILDPRLQLIARDLVPNLFAAKHCLDIGCNAGGVTCQLALDFHAASVVGVDIDPKLVAQASRLLALRASRARPATKDAERLVDWFPMSAVLDHGYIDSDIRASAVASAHSPWPRVRFHSADWAIGADLSGPYHVILALSVIKWIHLEHLDKGLVDFFRKCASSLSPDGYLVVELQNWDSYEKAIRPQKSPHFAPNFNQLRYRPETSFDELLALEGLQLHASSLALPRPIKVYRKHSPAHDDSTS